MTDDFQQQGPAGEHHAFARVDGPPLSGEIADLLLAEYQHHLAGIGEALGAGDLARVQELAHRLKGAVGLFHQDQAFGVAERLEQAARDRDAAAAAATWPALREELLSLIADVQSAIRRERGAPDPDEETDR